MEEKQFNLKCAEFLYPINIWIGSASFNKDVHISFAPEEGFKWPTSICNFNPYSNANDRNKVLEKMQLSTARGEDGKWRCLDGFDNKYNVHATSDSMETAQIKCIEFVLDS